MPCRCTRRCSSASSPRRRRWPGSTSLVIGRIGQGVVRDLRHRLYERLQQLGLAYYDRTPSGAIIARVMDDVGAIQVFVTGQTFSILTDLGTTLAIAALLLSRDWRLAVVVLVGRPAVRAELPLLHGANPRDQHVIREKMDLIFGNLKAKLDGTLVIKACAGAGGDRRVRGATGRRARARVCRRAASARRSRNLERPDRRRGHGAGVRGRGAGGSPGPDDARRRGRDGRPGRDDLRAGGAAGRPGLRLRADGRERRPARRDPRPRARRRRAGARRRSGRCPGPGRAGARAPSSSTGSASATRSGQPVVWDIRLKVEPGMKVALVGPTGCGKSTLVNLLMRFYDPTWGEIRLDGVPIRTSRPARSAARSASSCRIRSSSG